MAGAARYTTVQLVLGAAKASPGATLGQALGPLGLNMGEFVRSFNDRTAGYVADVPLRVNLRAFPNRTYEFDVKTPTTSWLLKQCAGIEKGAARPGLEVAGYVHVKHVYEIAKIKMADVPSDSGTTLEGMCRSVVGAARSMGLEVLTEREGEREMMLAEAKEAEDAFESDQEEI